MNQELEPIAELMGALQGSMHAFQRSIDELLVTQKSHIYESRDTIASHVASIEALQRQCEQLQEQQKDTLEYLKTRWADSLMEKAEEAGHAQARVFGKAIADDVIMTLYKDMNGVHQMIHNLTDKLNHVSRELGQRRFWLAASLIVILSALFLYITPSPTEIRSLRQEKAALEASIAEAENKGNHMKFAFCGPKKKLCVRVDQHDTYGDGDYVIIRDAK